MSLDDPRAKHPEDVMRVPVLEAERHWKPTKLRERHSCPPWCHVCPDIGGFVLPLCYGSLHRNDVKACACKRPKPREERAVVRSMGERLDRLERVMVTLLKGMRAQRRG